MFAQELEERVFHRTSSVEVRGGTRNIRPEMTSHLLENFLIQNAAFRDYSKLAPLSLPTLRFGHSFPHVGEGPAGGGTPLGSGAVTVTR